MIRYTRILYCNTPYYRVILTPIRAEIKEKQDGPIFRLLWAKFGGWDSDSGDIADNPGDYGSSEVTSFILPNKCSLFRT